MNSTVDHSVTLDIGGFALSNSLSYAENYPNLYNSTKKTKRKLSG